MPTVGGLPVKNPFGRSAPYFGNEVYSVEATVTLAQINAGYTFLPEVADVTYKVVGFKISVSGTFTTATDIRISDTKSTPVDIATLAIAQATDGAFLSETSAGITVGAGFGAALTANKGIQARKTGSSAAGGTSVTIRLLYKVNA